MDVEYQLSTADTYFIKGKILFLYDHSQGTNWNDLLVEKYST